MHIKSLDTWRHAGLNRSSPGFVNMQWVWMRWGPIGITFSCYFIASCTIKQLLISKQSTSTFTATGTQVQPAKKDALATRTSIKNTSGVLMTTFIMVPKIQRNSSDYGFDLNHICFYPVIDPLKGGWTPPHLFSYQRSLRIGELASSNLTIIARFITTLRVYATNYSFRH